jgi:two-component system phosphate regulon response regulator OmpR
MQETQPKILVVDDDARLRELLQRYLGEQGFAVRSVAESIALDRELDRERFDALVLDLMLPGEDGLSICRRINTSHPELPILMLTARGEDIDRIVGLEMGADDYLPKPFNPRELVARLRAILRRRSVSPPAAPLASGERIGIGTCTLDLGTRELFRGEEKLPLTSGEFAVLKALVAHPRQSLSRERLMELARGREHEAYDRSIDVQVSRLRKLIEPAGEKPRYIQTVWGYGYVFVPDGSSA